MKQIALSIAAFILAHASIASAAPTASAPVAAVAASAAASAPVSAFGTQAAATTAPLQITMKGTTIAINDLALSKMAPAFKSQLKTPWYETPQDFSGVSFKTVLEAYKVPKSASLKIIAYDGYTIELPASDAWQYDVLLATHNGGKRMTMRDKGPYFLIYPINQPGMNLPQFFSRCAWQIKTIEVQ